jgi:hypothetical protein
VSLGRGPVSPHAVRRDLWRAAAAISLLPLSLGAQERLVGTRSVAVGGSWERVTFSGAGLTQAAFAGLDTTRVPSASQITLPIAASTPLMDGWRLDVTALYGSGRVAYRTTTGDTRQAALGGVSDVRIRATGRMLRDNIVLTLGVNAPSGRTALDGEEFSALRVLSAPALGFASAPVGAGLSGTMGLVVAQQLGAWAVAYGTSYEARGRYQPVAALIAGTGTADYLPGGVFRASLGADRLVGPHRLSLAASADVFADDRLRGGVVGDTAFAGLPGSEASVRLGPVISADAQLIIAAPRVRELVAYSAYRWRAPFARDGRTVERSSGQYVEAGVRTVMPMGSGRDAILSLDGRWHSGLGVDQGLPTSGVTSGSVTTGVQFTRALLTIQPYVRGQVGSLTQRAALVPSVSQSFLGVGGGLVVVTRF